MTRCFYILIFPALLSGCALSTKPNQDLGFVEVTSLDHFQGCYANCSDPSDGAPLTCLSEKIWPDEFDRESVPDEVYVEAKNNSELMVKAFKDGREVKISIFKEGQHFSFINGRIELNREYIASGASQPGNVFIGVGTAKTILGIDAKGEGRIEQSTSFAGTGFLIIPLAGSSTDISRIKRKGASCDGR